MVRNGSFEIYASKIDQRAVTDDEWDFDIKGAEEVDSETYQRKVIDSRYQTIPIFKQEQINFGDKITNLQKNHSNVTYRYSKGTVILKKITLPPLNPGTTVIAELAAWSNGDAYDRTGSLFVIPVEKEISFMDAFQDSIGAVPVYKDKNGKEFQGVISCKNYEPALELMRFFTPFGVRHFNDNVKIKGYDWADSVLYRQEITELLPSDSSDIWIGIFIGNYDKGGHKASLNLKVYPSFGKQDTSAKWIKSLFNTLNICFMVIHCVSLLKSLKDLKNSN